MKTSKFARKTGKVFIPSAKKFTPNQKPIQSDNIDKSNLSLYELKNPQFQYPYKFCDTNLKEGCYSISIYQTISPYLLYRELRGSIRVEKADNGICISGDLYKKTIGGVIGSMRSKQVFAGNIGEDELVRPELRDVELLHYQIFKKKIPVYSRRSYYAYLLGTSARLFAIAYLNEPCPFSLDFDLYEFEHDATGYEGTFPAAPSKAIRLALQHTDIDHRYTGKMYEGATELGTVTMEWVSSYFRKAYLDIHTLQGAEAPQGV